MSFFLHDIHLVKTEPNPKVNRLLNVNRLLIYDVKYFKNPHIRNSIIIQMSLEYALLIFFNQIQVFVDGTSRFVQVGGSDPLFVSFVFFQLL